MPVDELETVRRRLAAQSVTRALRREPPNLLRTTESGLLPGLEQAQQDGLDSARP